MTQHQFEVAGIVRVDEKAGQLWYMARDGDNHLKLQLHRVGLDGKGDVRLTDPAFNALGRRSRRTAKHFIDVAQAHDVAPVTRLLDANGKVVAELAKSDLTKFDSLGLKKVEMFTYLAADGKTTLHGMISFPSNVRSEQEVSGADVRVRRSRVAGDVARNFADAAPRSTEYGFLSRESRLARAPAAWASACSTPST